MSEPTCGDCGVRLTLGGRRDSGTIRPWLPLALAPNHIHAPRIKSDDIEHE